MRPASYAGDNLAPSHQGAKVRRQGRYSTPCMAFGHPSVSRLHRSRAACELRPVERAAPPLASSLLGASATRAPLHRRAGSRPPAAWVTCCPHMSAAAAAACRPPPAACRQKAAVLTGPPPAPPQASHAPPAAASMAPPGGRLSEEEAAAAKQKFMALGVCDQLADAAAALGWKAPSSIQEQAVPLVLQGARRLGRGRECPDVGQAWWAAGTRRGLRSARAAALPRQQPAGASKAAASAHARRSSCRRLPRPAQTRT